MYKEIYEILNSKSIALVGASNNPAKWGYEVMDFLNRGGYKGEIYPVNPKEEMVWGLKCYKSLLEIPYEVEMIDICIPAKLVPDTIRQAMQIKAKNAVIFTAGFREAGRQDIEEEIMEIIKETDFRIIGPNVQGIIYPANHMCNAPEPLLTLEGSVGILSQSGSVSSAMGEWLQNEKIGISALINLGNQIDLDESDFIDFFAQDESTKVTALYLEGPNNNKKFKEALKRNALIKPIVLIKPGRTSIGKAVAISHTGSMAGNDKIFSNACRQYGITRCENITEFYDTVRAFATCNFPKGNRAVVLTTSGGLGSISADELQSYGIELANFPEDRIEEIKEKISSAGTHISNVMDLMVPIENWNAPVKALNEKLEDYFDIYFFMIADMLYNVEFLIEELSKKTDKTIVVTYMSGSHAEIKTREYLNKRGIIVYPTPDRAAKSLGNMIWYSKRKKALLNE